MSGDCEAPAEQLCDCCAGVTTETPELISNRPALSSIAYRAGRYATFDASMLAALSQPAFSGLAGLLTRDPADFSIALLDAWAVTLDILTFYQERFANEAFLRTATDQRSVFELAALVGYQPSPGVAASAVLAFTLSSAPGSPDNVQVPDGTRVQSVPGPGQTPQVFETTSEITAQIGLNALPAQTTDPWTLAGGDTSTWIAGTANNINVGDGLLFVAAQGGVPTGAKPTDFHYVTAVTPDPVAGNTQIFWDEQLSSEFAQGADSSEVCVYVFRKKAALYGVQAPNPETLKADNLVNVRGYPSGGGVGTTWDYTAIYTNGSQEINLDASYPGLAPQFGGPLQWAVLTGTEQDYCSVFLIDRALDTNPNAFTLTTKTTRLKLTMVEILSGDGSLDGDKLLFLFVKETPDITAYVQSEQLTLAPVAITTWDQDAKFERPAGMLAPVAGATLSVLGGQQIAAGQPIGVSGKRLRLRVPIGQNASFVPSGYSTGTDVPDGQVFVVEQFPPAADPANADIARWSAQTLSGVSGTLSVDADPAAVELLAADPKADPTVTEAAVVQSVTVDGDLTTLTLNAPLQRIYDASTVTVNANAVQATNGETVQEILGSGATATDPLQFTLKQSPLTYITASNGAGAASTLQVWVNNLRWTEVPNLLSAGPADRNYVTSDNAAGNTVLTFGDGTAGARPPTGTSNMRAVYRKGIGSAGMVSAGQLSQPLDRPQGVSSVTNPGAASGGADPATADEARASAPLPTLTIGRVVSLEDYQNFALGFAGIAKAWASWTWFGDIRGVFLTVAGANGATLSNDDPIMSSLISAIQLCSEPFVPLKIASYESLLFTFSALVAVDQPAYAPEQVLASVWQSVSAAFAFERRGLGQSVTASEIVDIIQNVPGVLALQLQGLGYSGEGLGSPAPAMLCASGPQPPAGAQLLQLDPATQGAIGAWS